MILEEIKLGKSDASKRETVLERTGNQVIVHDVHELWVHGVLLPEEGADTQCYRINVQDGRNSRLGKLWYHDLTQMIRLVESSMYPPPHLRE